MLIKLIELELTKIDTLLAHVENSSIPSGYRYIRHDFRQPFAINSDRASRVLNKLRDRQNLIKLFIINNRNKNETV